MTSSFHPPGHGHGHGHSHARPSAASYNHAMPMVSGAPAGTFASGTKVQVGNHRVIIEKYLSEGGFAHVYVARLSQPVDGEETAVLKRVAVPDKAALANMRTEVETMKKLKGHRHIVKYIDSHASQLKGGGYEVFLLMEFCQGGGLIDFMNTRLQNRLTEPEILKIFSDVAEGVACMHYLKPPLLHRDLKVENVLISKSGSSVRYKLCDFGSSAPPRAAATTAAEGRLIEDDIQRHTTLQYRSPEMIDVYRKHPIDEKSDIWALGVLLYKLCYYTTPFEEVGQMAILNASFKYPSYPVFSDRLKMLIASMLREHPQKRPNVYQVLREACGMQGKECPIKDIYEGRTQSETRRPQKTPTLPAEPPKVGAVFSPPIQETQIIPEIAPMRRGRPSRPTSQQNSARPSPSPLRKTSDDPFAALDGSKARQGTADELSARFPTLDQFSILHEKSGKFDFEPTVLEEQTAPAELSKRVTNALADEAFVKSPPAVPPASQVDPLGQDRLPRPTAQDRKASPERKPELPQRQAPLYQPQPQKATMVSTGTMTSQSPPPPAVDNNSFSTKSTIYRFPAANHERRPSSQPWAENEKKSTMQRMVPSRTASFFKREAKNFSTDEPNRAPESSRPSLETSRPAPADLDDALVRSKSANAKSRPASAYVGSKIDYRRDYEDTRVSPLPYDGEQLRHSRSDDYDRSNISSDVDYLRVKEEEEQERKREKRLSSGSKHAKRSSLSSISLSGTKTLLAGRFGDAFRRFESNTPGDKDSRSPSPHNTDRRLTPITGSEVTEMSDDGKTADEAEDVSPEMRRELERRRLSAEEKRVATAAAEYRERMAEKGDGGRRPGEGARSAAIQNRVQSLLQENNREPPAKTATGYGRFTNPDTAPQAKQFENTSAPRYGGPPQPSLRRLPSSEGREERPPLPPKDVREPAGISPSGYPRQQPPAANVSATTRMPMRPAAPPKPQKLRTGGRPGTSGSSNADPPSSSHGTPQSPGEDWEANFSRRYPSLSGLEMVETEIDLPKLPSLRTKEV